MTSLTIQETHEQYEAESISSSFALGCQAALTIADRLRILRLPKMAPSRSLRWRSTRRLMGVDPTKACAGFVRHC